MDNFKYLGSISIEVSKFKVLIRVAQETATFSKLKIIGGTEHLHLHLKHDVDTQLIFLHLCLQELDPSSRSKRLRRYGIK